MSVELRRSVRVSFPNAAGLKLAGIIDLPVDEPKALVVFAHCFTCSKDFKAIVRISRALAARGFGVLRFDFTGLGGSQGDFSLTNFSTNRLDLLAAIDFLGREYQPPVFLVGHSFGGACCLSVAAEVTSVRCIATLAAPSDTMHLAELLARKEPRIDRLGVGEVTIGGQAHTIARQMLDDFRSFDLPARLSQLDKPVVIFHSPVDETLGFEHALRLYSLLTQRSGSEREPSPASLICLPGADHLLTKQPADIDFIASAMAAWFERWLVG